MMAITKNQNRYIVPSPIFCDCGLPLFFDDEKEYNDDDFIECPYCKTAWVVTV